VLYALLMIVLGVTGYAVGVFQLFGTTKASGTALIPAFFGVVFLGLGLASVAKPSLNKHLMHAAAALGLLAIVAPVGRLVPLAIKGTLEASFGTFSLVLMMLFSAGFVGLCVKSFIDTRKARTSS